MTDAQKLHIPSLIARKRDGHELSAPEIQNLIEGFTTGTVPDYQMSAFAMAVFFSGMTDDETAALTSAIIDSGKRFSYPAGHPQIVDKPSTGGIGDKVSLVLAPLLACDNLWVPMVSGRGLGITGGTLDKLESIPGFSVNISMDDAITQLDEIGVVMMGQTDEFCPADRKLYALRDVSGTVPSIPLIVASIMGKKLAESLDSLVLDVKFGSGAFMQNRDDAKTLADAMVATGKRHGVKTTALLSSMNEPLGCSVGNALEVDEAVDVLRGGGPSDLRDLTLDLATAVASVSRNRLSEWLDDGTAFAKWQQLVAAQGGDPEHSGELANKIHQAPIIRDVQATSSGTVTAVDAQRIGQASLELGAGRATADAAIDPAVGFDQIVKTGTDLQSGDLLARVHARTESDANAAEDALRNAVQFGE